MKSITFGQTLVAVGLIGLTLPLALGQTGILYIGAAYELEGGPSPVGPIVALAATLAVAVVILVTGLARIRAEEAEAPLSHPQLLVSIGLLGFLIAGALSPVSLVFSIWSGWDEASWWTSSYVWSLALQCVAVVVPLLVIASNLKAARRGTASQGDADARPITCLAVLTLLITGAAAPGAAIHLIPTSFFASGGYEVEAVERSRIVGIEAGPAPELLSFALVALAIPIVVLLFLRWKEEGPGSTSYAALILVGLGLVTAVAGAVGIVLLLLFGLSIAATLWPRLRGHQSPNPPSSLNTGQLLSAVGLMCFALTSTQTYSLVFAFSYDEPAFPGPATALALAYAISLTILAIAITKLRRGTGRHPAEAPPSR